LLLTPNLTYHLLSTNVKSFLTILVVYTKKVKHIDHYLYLICTQGIILCPQANHSLDAYVDANFARQWHQAYSYLCDCMLSQSGYVLVYCGCPISWTSKIQIEIALSTTEANYQALSMCMHDVLPMHTLIQNYQPTASFMI